MNRLFLQDYINELDFSELVFFAIESWTYATKTYYFVNSLPENCCLFF